MSPDRPPQRGDVWWVAFDPSLGGESEDFRSELHLRGEQGVV